MVRIVKGIAAPETLKVFTRARELLDYKNATVTQQMSVLYGLWGVHWVRAENAAAHAVARQCLVLAAHTEQDRAAAALANYIMGDTFWTTGNFVEARHHLEWTIDLSAPLGSGITAPRFPHNHAIAALSFLAWTLWPLGYPQQAVTAAKQAVMRARATGHVPLTAFALLIEVFLATAFGAEGEPLVALADETVAYCVERGVKVYELYARFCLSVALARRDGPEHAIEVMRDAVEALEKINAAVFRTVFLYHLAGTHAGLGQLDVGLTLVEEALRMVENTGERLFEAELYRLRGELLLMFDEKDGAEMALEQALAIARRQHARMWELRAAVSLARLRRDQGRYAEARDLVAPICGWFTEGFDTPDLTDARALLEGLDV